MKKFVSMLLALCMLLTMAAVPAYAAVTDGVYTASAAGNNDAVTVEVTFSGAAITDVKVVAHAETPGLSDPAIERVPAAIVAGNTLAVDTVGGATVTSKAIIAAVEDAIKQAGGDPADYQTAAASGNAEKAHVEMEADVVVIGGGGAGLSAAIEASAKGASVILLEKMAYLGGNTAISGGLVPSAGTKMQAEAGIEDSPEKYAADIIAYNGGTGDPVLINVAAKEAQDLVPWFESIGAEFVGIIPFAGHSVDRLHQEKQLSGAGLVKTLEAAARSNGVEILMETKGNEIVTNEEGAICAVKATKVDGTELTINTKAVVLGTGGFASNKEMLAAYIPEMVDAGVVGHPGNTGDGIAMGLSLGAGLAYEDSYSSHAACNPEATLLITWESLTRGGILVNEKAERFTDETLGYVKNSPIVAAEERVHIIVDDYLREIVPKLPSYDHVTIKAHGVEELAAAINVDAAALRATIEEYNAGVEAGVDKFGRSMLGKPLDIDGNLYAIHVETFMLFTTGGLAIDTSARVLTPEGEVIPGLYAAGETAGTSVGGHGYTGYITGHGLLAALTFGRIAGRDVADFVAGK